MAAAKVNVIRVKTKKLSVSAKGAAIRGKKITVRAKKTFTLKAKVQPSDSTDEIRYSSSNRSVASVSKKGVVRAKRRGRAKITVRSGSKKVVIIVKVR